MRKRRGRRKGGQGGGEEEREGEGNNNMWWKHVQNINRLTVIAKNQKQFKRPTARAWGVYIGKGAGYIRSITESKIGVGREERE